MTAPSEQGASSGYGLTYWLLYLLRRWMVTLWSICLALASPVGGWFVAPVFVAAFVFDILLTPKALDLCISIPDLEREIEADRPLAAVLKSWPMPKSRWRALRMFIWLSLVFVLLNVTLLTISPADIVRWGYLNFAVYTNCGTAFASIFLVSISLSRISKKHDCSFRKFVNDVHARSTRYDMNALLFPGKLRLRISVIMGILLILCIWFWILFFYIISLNANIIEYGFGDYFSIFLGPIFSILCSSGLLAVFWDYKIVLSLRKTDPLAGMRAEPISRDALLSEQD